jgi:hypothetical protein
LSSNEDETPLAVGMTSRTSSDHRSRPLQPPHRGPSSCARRAAGGSSTPTRPPSSRTA